MPLLVIVRHGQSQWNLENRFTGIKDVSLTALGREEARVAGKKLKNMVFDHAFTSLLGRAQETLSIILGEIDQVQVPVEKNQALNERDYGELQGLNKAEVVAQYGAEQVEMTSQASNVLFGYWSHDIGGRTQETHRRPFS